MGQLFRVKGQTANYNIDLEFELSSEKAGLLIQAYGKHDGDDIQINFKELQFEGVCEFIDYLEVIKNKMVPMYQRQNQED